MESVQSQTIDRIIIILLWPDLFARFHVISRILIISSVWLAIATQLSNPASIPFKDLLLLFQIQLMNSIFN